MEINEIVKLITKRRDIIFRKLKEDKKSLDSYIFISNEFKKGIYAQMRDSVRSIKSFT